MALCTNEGIRFIVNTKEPYTGAIYTISITFPPPTVSSDCGTVIRVSFYFQIAFHKRISQHFRHFLSLSGRQNGGVRQHRLLYRYIILSRFILHTELHRSTDLHQVGDVVCISEMWFVSSVVSVSVFCLLLSALIIVWGCSSLNASKPNQNGFVLFKLMLKSTQKTNFYRSINLVIYFIRELSFHVIACRVMIKFSVFYEIQVGTLRRPLHFVIFFR
uniref:MSP domain-containing protein n=1 Tax=Heterorhabditis bacteriophora TaxID=37862 RepID=A0A1I7XBD1_HETBA